MADKTVTKQPKSVKITRKKGNFSASWTKQKTKKGSNSYSYNKITYSYFVGKPKKNKWGKDVEKSTTDKVNDFCKFDFKNYYPYKPKKKIKYINFRVKAKTQKTPYPKDYSENSVAKPYEIKPPKKPALSVAEGTYPSATFSYSIDANDTGHEVFSRFQYRTCLELSPSSTKGPSNSNKWSKWTFFSDNDKTKLATKFSGSKTFTEHSGTIAGHRYRRWFQVAAYGPGGYTLSNVVGMLYAPPNTPVIKETIEKGKKKDPSASNKGHSQYYNVYFKYSISRNAAVPIVSIMPQYYIGNPSDEELNPQTSGWTDTVQTLPPSGTDSFTGAAAFNTSTGLLENQCLWVRVYCKNSDKQNQTAYSDSYLVEKGTLSEPTLASLGTIDQTSLRAVVTATNPAASSVPGSFIAVYHTVNGKTSCIGVIPNGSASTVIQFAEYEEDPIVTLQTHAGGKYTASSEFKETEDTTVVSGKPYFVKTEDDEYVIVTNPQGNPSTNEWYEIVGESVYSVSSKWQSAKVDISSVVRAPQSVTVDRTDVSGSVRVSWDWPWQNADIAELSWADNPDSWESTSEPSRYEISKAKPGSWIIAGLENGMDWYIRVRLGKALENDVEYGQYTNAEPWPYPLTSSPSTPLLDVSKNVITKDGETTLSWVYSSADGQEQDSATVYEVVEEDGQTLYNELKTVGSEQYINIKAQDDSWTWSVGEEHTLAIKVKSKAGLDSENYSNTVKIRIADPINCFITNSSIVNGELTEMPLTFKAISGYIPTEDTSVTEGKSYYSRTDTTEYAYTALEEIEDPRYQEVLNPEGDPSTEGFYEFDGTTYSLSQDTEVNPEKTYYVQFIENPSADGWYEEDGSDYVLTQDTAMVSGKTYYTRAGDPNYVYSLIVNPSGNPKSNGYFEGEELSSDVSITAVVRRAEDFKQERPDESDFDGFEDETIYSGSPADDNVFTIENGSEDLIGYFDDRCSYVIELNIQDDLGQTAKDELRFTVNWSHQAWYPEATVVVDQEETVAYLTPIAPKSAIVYAPSDDLEIFDNTKYYELELVADPVDADLETYFVPNGTNYVYTTDTTIDPNKNYYLMSEVLNPVIEDIESYYEYSTIDVCDIYRLSVDKPELIYEGATFGKTYVDPYPTIGEYGGHRFVCRTANGDYITDENEIAWYDTDENDGDRFDTHANIIDFNNEQVFLLYEVDLSNSWSKDFQETKYLGGSIQGDWNPGVSRTATLNVTTVSDYDQDTIRLMHKLAAYPGICHVRTKDGASYSADVQVNETYEYTREPRFNKYDLSITRVDSETMDAVTLEEWQRENSEESE